MRNESGVTPAGDRVLVLPDVIETTSEGGIILPELELKKHQVAQMAGVLVAVGPDAWMDRTKITSRLIDNQLKVVERTTIGYSEPFAKVGDRVLFAQYNGQIVPGEDGKEYRLLNDEDITATVTEAVDLTALKKREPLSQA